MPGLMPPYKYNNYELVDGDLQKSWPLWRLSKNLCTDNERVLEFRLEGDYQGRGKNAIDFMNTVYSCVTSIATEFIVETYANRDKFDYIIINTGAVVIVDFNQPQEKREELVNIGYEQTKHLFESELPAQKISLIAAYTAIYDHLREIRKLLKVNDVQKAKNELGALFMTLYEVGINIDKYYSQEMKSLKDEFFQELQKTTFFGQYPPSKIRMIIRRTEDLMQLMEVRINELKEYVASRA
jgi:hypothetical protein